MFHKRSLISLKPISVAILCGIIFACVIVVWKISILLTKAAISTLIANLAPVWVSFYCIDSCSGFRRKAYKNGGVRSANCLAGIFRINECRGVFPRI